MFFPLTFQCCFFFFDWSAAQFFTLEPDLCGVSVKLILLKPKQLHFAGKWKQHLLDHIKRNRCVVLMSSSKGTGLQNWLDYVFIEFIFDAPIKFIKITEMFCHFSQFAFISGCTCYDFLYFLFFFSFLSFYYCISLFWLLVVWSLNCKI